MPCCTFQARYSWHTAHSCRQLQQAAAHVRPAGSCAGPCAAAWLPAPGSAGRPLPPAEPSHALHPAPCSCLDPVRRLFVKGSQSRSRSTSAEAHIQATCCSSSTCPMGTRQNAVSACMSFDRWDALPGEGVPKGTHAACRSSGPSPPQPLPASPAHASRHARFVSPLVSSICRDEQVLCSMRCMLWSCRRRRQVLWQADSIDGLFPR